MSVPFNPFATSSSNGGRASVTGPRKIAGSEIFDSSNVPKTTTATPTKKVLVNPFASSSSATKRESHATVPTPTPVPASVPVPRNNPFKTSTQTPTVPATSSSSSFPTSKSSVDPFKPPSAAATNSTQSTIASSKKNYGDDDDVNDPFSATMGSIPKSTMAAKQQQQPQSSFPPTQLRQQSSEEAESDPFAAPVLTTSNKIFASSSSSSDLEKNRATINSNPYGEEEDDDPFAVVTIPPKVGTSSFNQQPLQSQSQQQRQDPPQQQEIWEGEGSFPSVDDHEDDELDQDYVHISKPPLSVSINEGRSLSATASSQPQAVASATAPVPAAAGEPHSNLSHHNTITPIPIPVANINIAGFSLDQERWSRIEALTQWMKTNAPDIRIDLAITYADLFYQANATTVERLAKKLARQPTWLRELGMDEDDADEIAAAVARWSSSNSGASATTSSYSAPPPVAPTPQWASSLSSASGPVHDDDDDPYAIVASTVVSSGITAATSATATGGSHGMTMGTSNITGSGFSSSSSLPPNLSSSYTAPLPSSGPPAEDDDDEYEFDTNLASHTASALHVGGQQTSITNTPSEIPSHVDAPSHSVSLPSLVKSSFDAMFSQPLAPQQFDFANPVQGGFDAFDEDAADPFAIDTNRHPMDPTLQQQQQQQQQPPHWGSMDPTQPQTQQQPPIPPPLHDRESGSRSGSGSGSGWSMPQARPAQPFASPVSGGRSRAESDDPFGIPMPIPPLASSAAPQTTVPASGRAAASGGVFDWFGNSSTTTQPSANSLDDNDALGVPVGQRQGGPAVPAMPAFQNIPSAAPTLVPGNTKPTAIPAPSSSSLPPSGSSNSNNNAFINPFGNSGVSGGSDDDYDPFANFGTGGGASARANRSDSAAAMEKFRKMYDLPPTDTHDGLGTPSSHERPIKGDEDEDEDLDDDDDDDVFGLKAAGASVVKNPKQHANSPPTRPSAQPPRPAGFGAVGIGADAAKAKPTTASRGGFGHVIPPREGQHVMGGGNAATAGSGARRTGTTSHDSLENDEHDFTTEDHDDEGGGHSQPHITVGRGAGSGTEGHIMARLSTSNLLFTREWKQYYFVIQHGSLVMFKNKADYEYNPNIGGPATVKRRFPIEHNLRLLPIKAKDYGKGQVLHNFMMEEVMDYGPKTLAKFGSTDRDLVQLLWNQLKDMIMAKRRLIQPTHH